MNANRCFDSLDLYFRDIARFRPLAAAEERRIMAAVRNGDLKAREKLITANLRIVISVAQIYKGQGVDLCDLINEGNRGLIRATTSFDEKKNFKFISYAVWWIRQAILKALADHSRLCRLPLNAVGTIQKMTRAQEQLMQRFNRPPTWDEMVHASRCGGEVAQQVFFAMQQPLSFDNPVVDGSETHLSERVPEQSFGSPETHFSRNWSRNTMERLLAYLDNREHAVITAYFGIGRGKRSTLEHLAKNLGLSRERVRQIKRDALLRLRKTPFRNDLLECAAER
ncbi:MAG: RNA polymerase sigma factor RpoD/SigA [Chitinispirillaceae bacterium]|nr:RNA polymerase sigma factor RpoD/SigA [Chitinispirillaceae bacterium]